MIGTTIGHYKIIEKLGEAGQGHVWRALQLGTNRQVALKFPRVSFAASKRTFERFQREVELAAVLNHPNIAQIYDSGTHSGFYYYAMELIEGIHLDDYIRNNDLLQREKVELMLTVCQ